VIYTALHFIEAEHSAGAIVRTNPQILVVDDNADSRRILSRPFERRGFDVIEAEDGQSALALITSREFDLAFFDISMPELDGIELLKQIRSRYPRLPVIMVTGRADTDDVTEAFELGANDYVTKPVNIPVLMARAESQLARKRAEEGLQQALSDIANLNFELRKECARRAEAETRALDIAYHDPLTGLCNRMRLREKVVAAGVDGSFALLCLDLDGFKQVNDTLGHHAGDELLKAAADRLRGCVGELDTVGRLGGDEFAIVAPSAQGIAETVALAERVIDVISAPFLIEQHDVVVGCSVGIAIASDRDIAADRLFRDADAALYSAKADGKGTWRVAPADGAVLI
jgi:diguanylate cyclase (GGDEF)-like protein